MLRRKSNILSVNDVKEFLQISLCEAQNLLRQNEFPVIIIGNTARVFKDDFTKWLNRNSWVTKGNKRVTQAGEKV